MQLRPGDKVLLAGGQAFSGGFWLRSNSQGTASQPIVFSSYGSGQATIESGDSFGFYAHNTAGVELRNLVFVGSGRLTNRNSGVIFYLDSADTHLQHLRLDSLNVRGYQQNGITIGSWNGTSGYNDVRITNCQMHANGEAGLISFQFWPITSLAHHNWYVANCTAYDNSGRAEVSTTHTGNGIMLSGIDGAVIEKCTAYHNGWLNASQAGGPVGIWGWACNNLTIQRCESHHNQSGTSKDGGGFDLDGGCTNSVMQYNYSHDNQGAGYLLAQFPDAPAMHDVTIRYNISENDGQGDGQGALAVWSSGANGGIVRAAIYNNTVHVGQSIHGASPKAVYIMSDGITALTLRNNLFQTTAGLSVLTSATTAGVRLEGNCYWTTDGALQLNWGGTTYANLAAWRIATSQETLDAGTRPTGICTNPYPATTGTVSPFSNSVTSYIPGPTSALVGVGLNLKDEFNMDAGLQDFFGSPTPTAGSKGNIGASEVRSGVLQTTAATSSSAWCQAYPTIVQGEIHLAMGQPSTQLVQLRLLDLLGRQCWSWTQPSSQAQAAAFTLPISGIAAGRYILQMQRGSHVLHQSLVVAE